MAADVLRHMREAMSGAMAEVRKLQSGPPGTRERKAREQKALWDRIVAIPEPERQAIIDQMAKRAGHDAAEGQPCELCKFIVKHAGK